MSLVGAADRVHQAVVNVPLDPYLSIGDLSSYSGLAPRTLRGWIAAQVHALPSYKIGSRTLVRRSDYDAWALAHRRVGVNIEEKIERLQARTRKRA